MEHLRRFWQLNFNKNADFRPNYIVPNLNSIVRCLSNSNGLAVIPDFLCKTELESGRVKLLWQGKTPLKNTLYFATKKKTIYTDEIQLIKDTFKKIM
jgi:DNA-binding transcriptional LysR family regulator